MEAILMLYTQPTEPNLPLVCMDEVLKQLLCDVCDSLPAEQEQPRRVDCEYQRNGVANLSRFFEPF
jgi:hypothetical protein